MARPLRGNKRRVRITLWVKPETKSYFRRMARGSRKTPGDVADEMIGVLTLAEFSKTSK